MFMKKTKIYVLNGPNLNMLGLRNSTHYGTKTYPELIGHLANKFWNCTEFEFFQSNHEGIMVDKIHQLVIEDKFDGLIINPAAFTHYSIALRDAIELVKIPKIEVHLSDISERESFRQISLFTEICDYTFKGEQEISYEKAVVQLNEIINGK